MISELNDEEILDLLMTSEFEADFSPKELKFLLFKYRYFYRLLHGRLERNKVDKEGEIEKIKSELDAHKNEVFKLQVKNADQKNLINTLEGRKLTFRERLTGKIINKKDEDKRI